MPTLRFPHLGSLDLFKTMDRRNGDRDMGPMPGKEEDRYFCIDNVDSLRAATENVRGMMESRRWHAGTGGDRSNMGNSRTAIARQDCMPGTRLVMQITK